MADKKVTGKTNVYGLIGNPVTHSLSPAIHNFLAEASNVDSVYVTYSVDADKIEDAIKGAHSLGIKGLNVTAPYKKSILPFLCDVDDAANKIGAVNTLKYTNNGYEGCNTDITGIQKTIERHKIDLVKCPPLIIGAGGAAYSAAFACAEYTRKIYIVNRTNNNSELLATQIKRYYNVDVDVISYNDVSFVDEGYYILQTTPIGMCGCNEDFPCDRSLLVRRSSGVFDMIYSPTETDLIKEAAFFGKTSVNGIDMLIYQAIRSFELWNDIEVSKKCEKELIDYVIGLLSKHI